MSFASNVKDELSRQMSQSRHCQIAEIFGILLFSSSILVSARGEYTIRVSSENKALVSKISQLIRKAFHFQPEAAVREGRKERLYVCAVTDHVEALKILKAVKLVDEDDNLLEETDPSESMVLQKDCCRRSFLRGAYLAAGAMSNPENSYHMEIVCADEGRADTIEDMLLGLGVACKRSTRKGSELVYIKEGDAIVNFLGALQAGVSLMEFENLRILKEMRNRINRKVNCETANINKTVSASVKQLEDIELIDNNLGLVKLSPTLYEIAVLRQNYPDATLKELGEMMNPPVGKSGINHRMRKLSEIADKYR